jgi:hypothetical protein
MSANFGELRANHFHSGIDLRVGGAPGAKVFAVDSGYVMKIYISRTGYGKALYINHYNGQTSVYAHLDRFAGAFADYAEEYLYKNRRSTMNENLPQDLLKVKKGELIGYAGNSGSSMGAHLHFEIRETESQKPLNLVTRGYINPTDSKPPVFHRIAIFTLDSVNDIVRPRLLQSAKIIQNINGFTTEKTQIFQVCSPVFIGVNANDYQPDNRSRHGVYKMNVFLDDIPFFSYSLDGFEFKDTRYINSFIAYDELANSKTNYVKTYIEDGNMLPVYGACINKGLIFLNDTLLHNVKIELFDDSGNRSVLNFKIRKSNTVAVKRIKINPSDFIPIFWNRDFEYRDENLEFLLELESLYSNAQFRAVKTQIAKGYSYLWKLGYATVPIHKPARLKIKSSGLPDRLKPYAFIARKSGEKISYYGGQFDDAGFLVTETLDFGEYYVAVDTVPPKASIKSKSNVYTKRSKIVAEVSDNVSGINSCNAYIDGNWVLFEYDPKTNSAFHVFDKKRITATGKNRELKIVLTDNCGNKTEYLYRFIY